MISLLKSITADFGHLFFPHNCEGCGTDILQHNNLLCSRCLLQLSETGFFSLPGNPVEKIFYGRLPLVQAGAAYYFTKQSLLQHLLVQLKYKQHREMGYFLGRMMGRMLQASGRFEETDFLIPVPLNNKKERSRGYNQALLICEGIATVWNKPLLAHAINRTRFTHTQTHQNRLSRWQNMENVFAVNDPIALQNKHILLVDDVITTGATLEACGTALFKAGNVRVSIGSVAYTI